jgi:hypothetical protein
MALAHYTGTTARPADTVNVYAHATLNAAVLYEDEIGTLLGNPFTSDVVTGEYEFYTENVPLDIVDSTP